MTTTFDKDERRRRVEDVLKALDLWESRKKRTWLMSGCMKKKVEDAKILVQRPSIAVFDEPTAFLDVPSRLLVWKMIRQLRDEGSTVIVATNMMDEAERLSERVAIVNKGKLVASETPEQLKGTVKGGEVLELTLNDGSEFRPDMLTKFPEVYDVKKQDNKILVFLNSGTLLLPKIVDTLSTQGFKIESVKLKEVSLEDVFLTYTGQRLE
jgi:ABC-2 type transport system ATP-binding protein